jgi:hypothetical protein
MSKKTFCSHGDPIAPCGWDDWCDEEGGHAGPHTGQLVRCACGTAASASLQPGYVKPGPYEAARERFVRTGDLADLSAMLEHVT